jgi:reverse gyrase
MKKQIFKLAPCKRCCSDKTEKDLIKIYQKFLENKEYSDLWTLSKKVVEKINNLTEEYFQRTKMIQFSLRMDDKVIITTFGMYKFFSQTGLGLCRTCRLGTYMYKKTANYPGILV